MAKIQEPTKGFWTRGKHLVAFVASIVTATPGIAHAQDAQDTASAETLFAAARKLMADGKPAEACPKLEESERLAPAVGTLLNLGVCYEKTGRTASAWATFKEAVPLARASGQSSRQKFAEAHAATLASKLGTLTVHVPASVAAVPGVEIMRDGVVVSRAAWDTAMPLDAGSHVVAARAPGYREWSIGANVTDASKGRVEIADLVRLPPEPKVKVAAAVVAPLPPAKTVPQASGTQRTIGLVVGGVGLAGLAAGGVLGLVAKSKNDDAMQNHCQPTSFCDAEGLRLTDQARTFGNASTIAFVSGGVALATGAVLFFTAPKRRAEGSVHAQPMVSARGGGLVVGGSW